VAELLGDVGRDVDVEPGVAGALLQAEAGLVELDADLEVAAATATAAVLGAVTARGQAEGDHRCGGDGPELTNLHVFPPGCGSRRRGDAVELVGPGSAGEAGLSW
jgi:hypothetical protein